MKRTSSMRAPSCAFVTATAAFLWLAGAGIGAAAPQTPDPDPGPGPVLTQPGTRPAPAANSRVEAGATGDGPATQDDCDQYAETINAYEDIAEESAKKGDGGGMIMASHLSDETEKDALDAGCFVMGKE